MRYVAALFVGVSCSLFAQAGRHNYSFPRTPAVPFVGCSADGMSGPVAATKGFPRQLKIPAEAAARLAWYEVKDGLGVLAPRGWHCYELYGSDGAFLVVSPDATSSDSIYAARRPNGFTRPVIVLSAINGFTSGRDEVSPVVNRVFPTHRKFVIDTARNMDQPIPPRKVPFRYDKLHYLSGESVEFTTPSHREGLGTIGFLRPADLPVTGVEILVKEGGDCCDLTSLAIRLPTADIDLATVIRQQMEHDTMSR